MSSARKTCLYKGCARDPELTHFKFPEEQKRFIVWCKNAGLYKDFTGVVDITETRYLCEKHFSSNYICSQARRKMLVQTAFPERCEDYEDYEVKFTITGGSSTRKRRISMRDYSIEELALPVTKRVIAPATAPVILNSTVPVRPQRISSRQVSAPSTSTSASLKAEKSPEQVLKVKRKGPTAAASSSKSSDYEEVFYKAPKKYSLLVVKPKPESKPIILNQVTITPAPDEEEIIEEQPVYSIEEENISSTQDKPEEPEEPEKCEEMEKYSEFIFNGEMYVQMPKRVFEAEKNRIRKESEKFKLLLQKLKAHLAKMPDLD